MLNKIYLRFTCLLFILLIDHLCFSQSGNFSLGVKAGVAIPNLKASGNNPVSEGWSSRLGPYAGAVAALRLNERFSLRAELNYASQGGKKNGVQAIPTSGFESYFPEG